MVLSEEEVVCDILPYAHSVITIGKSPGDPQTAGESLVEYAITPGIPHPINGVSVSAHGRECVHLQPKMTHNFPPVMMSTSKCVIVHVCVQPNIKELN